MRKIHVQAGGLAGTVQLPPSKSIAHRLLFMEGISSLMGGPRGQILGKNLPSEAGDIKETRKSLERLLQGSFDFNCLESAASYRFLTATAAFHLLNRAQAGLKSNQKSVFIKIGPALLHRPTEPLFNALRDYGFKVACKDRVLQISVSEDLLKKHKSSTSPNEFRLSGNLSSQFASGLLMALPLIGGGEISILGRQVSRPYLDMTIELMRVYGINPEIQTTPKGGLILKVNSNASYELPAVCRLEGDASAAAFWLVANKLGSNIKISNLPKSKLQGDSRLEDILATAGDRAPLAIDLTDSPDLAPPLAVYGSFREGGIILEACTRLKHKETNRVQAIVTMINSLGGKARFEDGGERITIEGKPLAGGKLDASKDHRIAMAAAIAASRCPEGVTIEGADSVAKSYPQFWEDFKSLGGKIK